MIEPKRRIYPANEAYNEAARAETGKPYITREEAPMIDDPFKPLSAKNLKAADPTKPSSSAKVTKAAQDRGMAASMKNRAAQVQLHWRIKVVPNDNLNVEGRWIECGPQVINPKATFSGAFVVLKPFCPVGHQVVAIRSRRVIPK